MTSINANSAVRPAAPTDANAAEMPAVSVVIPTWNRPAFLREALAALVSGEHQDFEVLVMDQTEGLDAERVVAEFDKRFVYHRMARRGANPAHLQLLPSPPSADCSPTCRHPPAAFPMRIGMWDSM